MARKQRENESIAEFANSIRELIARAYPDSQQFTVNMRKKFEIKYFRNGLRHSLQQHILRTQIESSLDEEIEKALKEEFTQKTLENNNNWNINSAQILSEIKKLKERTEEINYQTEINFIRRLNFRNNYRQNSFQYSNNAFKPNYTNSKPNFAKYNSNFVNFRPNNRARTPFRNNNQRSYQTQSGPNFNNYRTFNQRQNHNNNNNRVQFNVTSNQQNRSKRDQSRPRYSINAVEQEDTQRHSN